MQLVELPDTLRENIVSFLSPHSSDRISLAATCRQLLNDVEVFSVKELKRIASEHAVDETWLFRAGMEVAADGAEKTGELSVDLSNSVSRRRMLRAAYKTHIYSLGASPPQRMSASLSLAMHPDGKRMLSGGHGAGWEDHNNLRLWDLSTNQCIQTFVGHTRPVNFVSFGAGHVISTSDDRTLRIWELDGTCKQVHPIDSGRVVSLDVSAEDVYCVCRRFRRISQGSSSPRYCLTSFIHVVNIRTGVSIAGMPAWIGGLSSDPPALIKVLRVCGNYLLALLGFNSRGFDTDRAGLYVVDRENVMEEKSHFLGNYCSMQCSSDGHVVAVKEDGRFDVFHLEDGHLVFLHSFNYHSTIHHPDSRTIMLMSQSRVYIKGKRDIEVYDILTGVMERKLHGFTRDSRTGYDYRLRCMAVNEKELFVGFNIGGGPRSAFAINAYLL